jgi:hypothetical protein
MSEPIMLYMLAGHALADYPLQGDWLSKAKSHKLDLVPGETIWPLALLSHSMIHALAVFLATNSMFLATAEFIAHTIIDHAKCDGRISYNTDQYLHIGCKFVWVALYIFLWGAP